jgi:hypothetical protein
MTSIEIWIERLEKGHWIDWRLKYPKIAENVIVLLQDGSIRIAHISGSNSWYDWQIAFEYDVTHWMPLENAKLGWKESDAKDEINLKP